VVSVNPPQLRAVLAFLRRARRLARAQPSTPSGDGFGIPFVDYARGDGVAIGAGHDAEWSPVLIDDATMWVWAYRGLWGLDTRDRFGGERAPAGPRYERDGSVRSSWANPLGWARFADLVRGTSIPVYALGGLDRGDLDVALSHGAHGVALRRAAWSGRNLSAFV